MGRETLALLQHQSWVPMNKYIKSLDKILSAVLNSKRQCNNYFLSEWQSEMCQTLTSWTLNYNSLIFILSEYGNSCLGKIWTMENTSQVYTLNCSSNFPIKLEKLLCTQPSFSGKVKTLAVMSHCILLIIIDSFIFILR